jgi:hypothetical protein
MPRRKNSVEAPRYPEDWVVSEEMTVNKRNVVPGTEMSFVGQKGRFLFIKHVINGKHEWIDVISNSGQFRSFRPSEVKRVHWKNMTRQNAKKQG